MAAGENAKPDEAVCKVAQPPEISSIEWMQAKMNFYQRRPLEAQD
jgi:hypothetical protein